MGLTNTFSLKFRGDLKNLTITINYCRMLLKGLMEEQTMDKLLNDWKLDINTLNNAEITNINEYKVNLSYLTVQSTSLKQSTFKNCDIVGLKIYDSTFSDILLNNADIISIQASNCKFTNVNFDGTCMEDIYFTKCVFENCSFKNFTMKNCCFDECEFYNFKPTCCLCELNNYKDCSFVDSLFSSSFHYQIFSDCRFINTQVELELLGYNYGLLDNSIIVDEIGSKSFDSINNIDYLYNSYLNQKLYANAFILKINYEYHDNPSVLLLWVDFLEIILQNNIIIKSNELVFIKNLISHFSNTNEIAPLLLFALNNKLINTINKFQVENSKIRDDIIVLINNVYFEFKKITQSFVFEIDNCSTNDGNSLIEIKYLEKPTKDLSQILNKFGVGYCQQIKTKTGSFYEWISCPDNMVQCLEVFLMLLGIAVPIVYDSIKTKKKKQKIGEPVKALYLSDNNTNITVNITINNGCQILNNYNFIENNFYGYNNKNVQKISISAEK